MRQSFRRTLVWQAVGLLCYFLGMLLFLVVAVGVFLSPPEYSLSNIGPADGAMVLVSLVFMVAGRAVSWKFGGESALWSRAEMIRGGGAPDQTKLEELGYYSPPGESETGDSDFAYDDGEVYAVCEECGAKNDPEFRFCNNCSAELPD